jgi:hypothetical protein
MLTAKTMVALRPTTRGTLKVERPLTQMLIPSACDDRTQLLASLVSRAAVIAWLLISQAQAVLTLQAPRRLPPRDRHRSVWPSASRR